MNKILTPKEAAKSIIREAEIAARDAKIPAKDVEQFKAAFIMKAFS